MLTPTWNEKFELPDGSYSVSDIQNYFEYILNKNETVTHNSLIMIYVNKNRRQFEKKNGKNMLHLEVTEGSSINRL